MPGRWRAPHPEAETIRVVMVEPRTVLGLGVREVLDSEPELLDRRTRIAGREPAHQLRDAEWHRVKAG